MSGPEQKSRRKRGRPPAQQPRHHRLDFRVGDHLRQTLEASAARSGRSISAEIDYLLSRALTNDQLIFGLYGGPPHIRKAMEAIAHVFSTLEMETGRKAFGPDGDPWLHAQAWRALSLWFTSTRPPGEAKPPEDLTSDQYNPRPAPAEYIKEIGRLTMARRLSRAETPFTLSDLQEERELLAQRLAAGSSKQEKPK